MYIVVLDIKQRKFFYDDRSVMVSSFIDDSSTDGLAINDWASCSLNPRRYKISVRDSPFSFVGASNCTMLFAHHATPNPASFSIRRSLAPSPTARV